MSDVFTTGYQWCQSDPCRCGKSSVGSACSLAPLCIHCRFYRAEIKRQGRKYINCTPTEFEDVPTGQGECMLAPPSVQFRQAAVDRNKTWAGPVTSVVNPGFVQSRPRVLESDFCGSFAEKVQ